MTHTIRKPKSHIEKSHARCIPKDILRYICLHLFLMILFIFHLFKAHVLQKTIQGITMSDGSGSDFDQSWLCVL